MAENSEYVSFELQKAAATSFASDEAEKSLLGCFVTNFKDCVGQFNELVEDDFYYDNHRIIFRAIKQARAEQLDVDLITIDQMFEKIAPGEANRYTSDAIECTRTLAFAWNVDSYLTVVKSLSTRRKALAMMAQVQQQLSDPAQDINGIMDKLRTEAGDINIGKHSWVTMSDVMLATYDYLEQRVKGETVSITSGIRNVDAVIGGFFGGELTVIGARPAVGKSVFGMNVALAAAEKGFKVGICSREMTDIQFGQRILSYHSMYWHGDERIKARGLGHRDYDDYEVILVVA